MHFYVSILALSFLISGCGSTQKIERDRVDQFKKVAVIGFGLEQMRPIEGSDVVKAVLGDEQAQLEALPISVTSNTANQMYLDLTTQLAKATGWSVMTQTQLRNHPAYRMLYEVRTRQPQLRPLVKARTDGLVPEGIVEGFLLTTLGETDRAALMKDLGVDGVVVVTVRSNLTNDANVFEKLIAKGSFHRQVGLKFEVFDRGGNDAAWFDGKSQEESKEGVPHTLGFSAADRLEKLSVETAHDVFAKVTENYKKL